MINPHHTSQPTAHSPQAPAGAQHSPANGLGQWFQRALGQICKPIMGLMGALTNGSQARRPQQPLGQQQASQGQLPRDPVVAMRQAITKKDGRLLNQLIGLNPPLTAIDAHRVLGDAVMANNPEATDFALTHMPVHASAMARSQLHVAAFGGSDKALRVLLNTLPLSHQQEMAVLASATEGRRLNCVLTILDRGEVQQLSGFQAWLTNCPASFKQAIHNQANSAKLEIDQSVKACLAFPAPVNKLVLASAINQPLLAKAYPALSATQRQALYAKNLT